MFSCLICKVKTTTEDVCAECNKQMEEELYELQEMSDAQLMAMWEQENPGKSWDEYAESMHQKFLRLVDKVMTESAVKERGGKVLQ